MIKEISKFIGKPITDEQLDKIVEATKFDKMKNDPSTNYKWWDDNGIRIKTEMPFFRKGKTFVCFVFNGLHTLIKNIIL